MTKAYHIDALPKDVAKTVLMCGDPLRAQKYTKLYLTNANLVCNLRNILMYTGFYNGHKVTIMGHGMGLSSIAIYAHELFSYYEVERIVRLGSAGGYSSDLKLGDIVIGDWYYTYSRIGEGYGRNPSLPVSASEKLLKTVENQFQIEKESYFKGGIYSSLWFYAPDSAFFGEGIKKDSEIAKLVQENKIIAKEMESYILQVIAEYFQREALTVVTIVGMIRGTKDAAIEENISTDKMGEMVLKALFK